MTLKSPDDKPNQAARTAIITRLRSLGYTATDLAPIIRSGRTRREIALDLIALQQKAPRG